MDVGGWGFILDFEVQLRVFRKCYFFLKSFHLVQCDFRGGYKGESMDSGLWVTIIKVLHPAGLITGQLFIIFIVKLYLNIFVVSVCINCFNPLLV